MGSFFSDSSLKVPWIRKGLRHFRPRSEANLPFESSLDPKGIATELRFGFAGFLMFESSLDPKGIATETRS